jgi:hypothetical protein
MDYEFQTRFLTQGRFALVDAHFRNIWLNISNQHHALAIRNVFRGKLSLLVCDLSVFENFESVQHEITSYTCLNWQLPLTDNIGLITTSLKNPIFDQVQTSYCSVNAALGIGSATSLLTQKRQLELQDQLLLYNRILELIDIAKLTCANSVEFIDQINKIFSIEIHYVDIVEQLYQLSKPYIGIVSVLPSCILTTLKKNLYE